MASNPPERMKLHRGAVHSAMHEYIYIFHFTNFILKFRYSEKATKGPGAKNDSSESPGCFNQILTFESQKRSPVATF